jgi:hypothetical protein
MNEQTQNEVTRLPLWESCLDKIREHGIGYGVKFTTAWLESQLKCAANTIEFGIAIANINEQLIDEGYYLTAREQKGSGYVVAQPDRAEAVADNWQRESFRCMHKSIRLTNGILSNTDAQLDADARRRLEGKAERNAIRLALMSRATSVAKCIEKHAPKLLK